MQDDPLDSCHRLSFNCLYAQIYIQLMILYKCVQSRLFIWFLYLAIVTFHCKFIDDYRWDRVWVKFKVYSKFYVKRSINWMVLQSSPPLYCVKIFLKNRQPIWTNRTVIERKIKYLKRIFIYFCKYSMQNIVLFVVKIDSFIKMDHVQLFMPYRMEIQ